MAKSGFVGLGSMGDAMAKNLIKAGIDMKKMVDVIRASSGNSWLTKNRDMYIQFVSMVFTDPAMTENMEDILKKDIVSIVEMTRELGIDAPVAEAVLTMANSGEFLTKDLLDEMAKVKIGAGGN